MLGTLPCDRHGLSQRDDLPFAEWTPPRLLDTDDLVAELAEHRCTGLSVGFMLRASTESDRVRLDGRFIHAGAVDLPELRVLFESLFNGILGNGSPAA